jgi:hypothetical protein
MDHVASFSVAAITTAQHQIGNRPLDKLRCMLVRYNSKVEVVFWHVGAFEPIIQNAEKTKFKNVKKFQDKIPRVHSDILYSRTSFRGKRTFYMVCVKRQKNIP